MQEFYARNCAASATFVQEESRRTTWLQDHTFRVDASTCIDGRVLDLPLAIGVPIGVMEIYRSAGARVDFRTLSYARRCLDGVRKARRTRIRGVDKQMATMRLVTVHYSASRPHDASCAAWKHQTNRALEAMKQNADDLNTAFPGEIVAFPVLVDTDADAITVKGPGGDLSAYELLEDPSMVNGSSSSALVERLVHVFPPTWHPLAQLTDVYRNAFYAELAERLIANLNFVRQVMEARRPVELLDHQERMVFVGRHADWITTHNTIFLIDDTDTDASVRASFEIALRYVVRNVIRDAVAAAKQDWTVPVIINVPHDDDDLALTRIYTRKLERSLKLQLEKCEGKLHHWLTIHLADEEIPGWMRTQLVTLASRVRFYPSVSHRSSRLFVLD